jgi:hypothetical protein
MVKSSLHLGLKLKDHRYLEAMVLHLPEAAGKSLSVLTTAHPSYAGRLLPIGVALVYRINQYVSMKIP